MSGWQVKAHASLWALLPVIQHLCDLVELGRGDTQVPTFQKCQYKHYMDATYHGGSMEYPLIRLLANPWPPDSRIFYLDEILEEKTLQRQACLQCRGNLGLPIRQHHSPLRQASECISIPRRTPKFLRRKWRCSRDYTGVGREPIGLLKNTDRSTELSMNSHREKHAGSETRGDTWAQMERHL